MGSVWIYTFIMCMLLIVLCIILTNRNINSVTTYIMIDMPHVKWVVQFDYIITLREWERGELGCVFSGKWLNYETTRLIHDVNNK
jgi:hypothetical protein